MIPMSGIVMKPKMTIGDSLQEGSSAEEEQGMIYELPSTNFWK
jgi:hypothetical protein